MRRFWATRFAAGLSAAISLRSISASIPVASVRCAHSALRLAKSPTRRAVIPHTVPDSCVVILAPALRAALVTVLASLALAGCAGGGHRLGSSRRHSVRRRCGLRPAPRSALRRARPAARVSPLVRALLRSTPALCSAPRRAPVPAPVRTLPSPPPPECRARPPAAVSALPSRSIAAAAPSRRSDPDRFSVRPSPSACPFVRPAALFGHTRRIVDARRARMPMRCLACPEC